MPDVKAICSKNTVVNQQTKPANCCKLKTIDCALLVIALIGAVAAAVGLAALGTHLGWWSSATLAHLNQIECFSLIGAGGGTLLISLIVLMVVNYRKSTGEKTQSSKKDHVPFKSGQELKQIEEALGKWVKEGDQHEQTYREDVKKRILECCDQNDYLVLNHCHITTLPPVIFQLQHLRGLQICGLKMDAFPNEIFNLQNLKYLTLDDCELPSLPDDIDKLTHLENLMLRNNKLTSLPSRITNLSNLRLLSLEQNNFSVFPAEIFALPQLDALYLSKNQIGSIPSEISNLKQLERLELNQNGLKELPKEIGSLKNLKFLWLDDNQLSSLPGEIRQLEKLEEFALSRNQFNAFPLEIKDFKSLKKVLLNSNQITTLPSDIQDWSNQLTIWIKGNPIPSVEIDNLKNATQGPKIKDV